MLRLGSNPTLFCAVRGAVEHLSEALGFPESHCSSITRPVDEALTNIARHSYNKRLEQPITVYFRTTQRDRHGKVQQGLEILLGDRGSWRGFEQATWTSSRRIQTGGLGLHAMRQAMDTVEFIRKGSTNRTRLVKYLAQTHDTP